MQVVAIPSVWTMGRLRDWIDLAAGLGCSTRLVHKGCPTSDKDEVRAYADELIHVIRQIAGS